MTQNPDLSRSSAPRRAARHTSKTRAVLLAAVLLVGSAMVPAHATVPTSGGATGTAPVSDTIAEDLSEGVPAAPSAQGTVDVSIIDVSHPTAKHGDEVTIRAKVTNRTGAVVSGANVNFAVDYVAITSRSEVSEWASAALLDPVRGAPTTKPLGRLNAGASKDVSFTYNPGVQYLQGFGPRRFAVSVDDATGRLGIARSFLLYDADGAKRPPMRLSILAGITGPATDPATDPADPSTTDIELAQLAAAGQRLDGVVEVAEDSKLSLAVDPAVMAVAAASNDSALSAWSERLLDAADDTTTYALPDQDPDLAALAHANVRTTGPRGFLHAPRLDNWPVPKSWRQDLAWPADGVVPDLETLGLAVKAGRSNVLVSGGLVAESGMATGRAEVATLDGTAHAAVTDSALTNAFLSATDLSQAEATNTENAAGTDSAGTATTAAEGTQRLLAETAVVSQSPEGPPTMSIVMPRTWTPDAEAATSILKELEDAEWVETTTLDDLFAQDAPVVVREPLPKRNVNKAELAPASVAALERARDAVVTFSSVAVDDPDPLWRPGVTRLAAPLAVAQRADPGIRDLLVRQTLEATEEFTHQSVTVVPRQDINFITDVGNIPVRVRNALDVDATVTVVLRPDHPRLTVDKRSIMTVPAGQEVDVQVPVRAIGSGDVEVTAQVLTPTGAKITDDSSFQVRVRAGWEEVGTWIAAGLVALLFLAGIWRTVRRGRSPYRATREEVEEATGTPAEAMPVATHSVATRAE